MFFKMYLKQFLISDSEYDSSGNSNFSFHVGVDIFVWLFYIFPYIVMLRFDKATYL